MKGGVIFSRSWSANPLYQPPHKEKTDSDDDGEDDDMKEMEDSEQHIGEKQSTMSMDRNHVKWRAARKWNHGQALRTQSFGGQSETSPRRQQRRRRELELEARTGGGTTSSDDETTDDIPHSSGDEHRTQRTSRKVSLSPQSASPNAGRVVSDENEKAKRAIVGASAMRPSYRRYLRNKRSRSRDKLQSASTGILHQTSAPAADEVLAPSQVHWEVHRMPQAYGSATSYAMPAPTQPIPIETAPTTQQAPLQLLQFHHQQQQQQQQQQAAQQFYANQNSQFQYQPQMYHQVAPMANQPQFYPAPVNRITPPSTDKANIRKSWLNISSRQPPLEFGLSFARSPTKSQEHTSLESSAASIQPMAILSHSLHDSLSGSSHSQQQPQQRQHQLYQTTKAATLDVVEPLQQQNQQQLMSSQRRHYRQQSRSSQESSPLDTIPVKEETPRKTLLKISENSAFRPIQPEADQNRPPAKDAAIVVQPSFVSGNSIEAPRVVSYPSPKRPQGKSKTSDFPDVHGQNGGDRDVVAGDDELIYVSVKDVMSHTPAKAQEPSYRKAQRSYQTQQENAVRKPPGDIRPPAVADMSAVTVLPVQVPISKVTHEPLKQSNSSNIVSRAGVDVNQPLWKSQSTAYMSHQPPVQTANAPTENIVPFKPFYSKPPPLDESNLERWRARKRSKELNDGERRQLFSRGITHIGSSGVKPRERSEEIYNRVPLARSHTTDVGNYHPKVGDTRSRQTTTRTASNQPAQSALPTLGENAELVAARPKPSFRRQFAADSMDQTVTADFADEQGASAAKIWFVTPGKLESSSIPEATAAAAWKQRETNTKESVDYSLTSTEQAQPPVHDAEDASHTKSAALAVAPPELVISASIQRAPEHSDRSMEEITSASSLPRPQTTVAGTLAQMHHPPQQPRPATTSIPPLSTSSAAAVSAPRSPVASLPPPTAEQLSTSPFNTGETAISSPSLSAVVSGQNVSSKARLFETMAIEEEAQKQKSFYATSLGQFQPLRVSPVKKLQLLLPKSKTIQLPDHIVASMTGQRAAVTSATPNAAVHHQRNENAAKRSPPVPTQSTKPTSVEAQRDEEDSQQKLSVMEKMRIFEKKIDELEKRRARRQTQPVTQDELVAAAVTLRSTLDAAAKKSDDVPNKFVTDPSTAPISSEKQPQDASVAETKQRAVAPKRVVYLHTEESQPSQQKHDVVGEPQIPETDTVEGQAEKENSSREPEESAEETKVQATTAVQRRREARQKRRMGLLLTDSPLSTTPVSPPAQSPLTVSDDSLPIVAHFDDDSTAAADSTTMPVQVTPDGEKAGPSLADRMDALRSNGERGWRRRIEDKGMSENDVAVVFRKPSCNGAATPTISADESKENNGSTSTLTEKRPQTIADRLSQLTRSADGWQKRRPGDEERRPLTVVGKLEKAGITRSPAVAAVRKTTGGRTATKQTSITATPEKHILSSKPRPVSTVVVPKQFDEGFGAFFASSPAFTISDRPQSVAVDCLDAIKSDQPRLGFSKDVRLPKRRKQSSNPVKSLASREDLLRDEYDEKTPYRLPVAMRKANSGAAKPRPVSAYVVALDPLALAGNRGSQLADEALRALATKEDFSAVQLKRADASKTPSNVLQYPPYKHPMLIQLRGRKHVDMRLLKPNVESLHSGGCFLLIDDNELFLLEGEFANVLEKAKAHEAASYVLGTHDLGCRNASRVVETATDRTSSASFKRFCLSLGTQNPPDKIYAPSDIDAEERYECRVARDNTAVYHFDGDTLVRCDELSDRLLSYDVLVSDKVVVFDFGSEVYVWSGRSCTTEQRRVVVEAARKKFPYDDWRIFGEVKDRMETVLFRAKFENWPDEDALKSVQIKSIVDTPKLNTTALVNGLTKRQILAFKDPDSVSQTAEELGKSLVKRTRVEPDLKLEDQSVGRGREVFNPLDPALSKYEVVTEKVTQYRCGAEGEDVHEIVGDKFGHFEGDQCYIVRWRYRVSVAGRRDLKGKVAAVRETGRSRSAFFYWIGSDTNRSQQGFCALAVKHLDTDRSPQVRVTQGLEPPAFLNLFRGTVVLHEPLRRLAGSHVRIYAAMGGPFPEEFCWTETDPNPNISLRSQSSYLLLVDGERDAILWHGRLSPEHIRTNSKSSAAAVFGARHNISTCEEGSESAALRRRFGGSASVWTFPKPSEGLADGVRLFRFFAQSGDREFGAAESVGACYSRTAAVAFPFEQDDLYAAEQPAMFLIDQGGSRLWLWQGWLEPAVDADESAAQKLRMLRLFALRTASVYWTEKAGPCDRAQLIHAGCEPVCFRALFPLWTEQEEAISASKQAKRTDGEMTNVFELLSELSRTEYPLERLCARPPPDGVDSSRLESYLSDSDFLTVFKLTKQLFYEQPSWKQIQLKKDNDLF